MEDDIVISCIRTVVVKACDTAATLAKFTCSRILDLIGLVFNIVAICSLVRAYPTVRTIYSHRDDKKRRWWAWRLVGIHQILILITDIPFFVMLVLQTVFTWRLVILIHTKKKEKTEWVDHHMFQEVGYTGFTFRTEIFLNFCGLVTDILVVPFGIVVFLSWRSFWAYKSIVQKEKDFDRKLDLMLQFVLVFLDLTVMFMFLIQCITWRAGLMIQIVQRIPIKRSLLEIHFNREPSDSRREVMISDILQGFVRYKVFFNFLRLLLDLLMLPFVVLLLFSWRAPVLFKKFSKYREQSNPKVEVGVKMMLPIQLKIENRLRGGIMTHFGRYCIDLAMIVPTIFVFCSWRCPILILKFKKFLQSKRKRPDENRLRKTILFHAVQFLVDVLSILPMILTLCSWRLYFFLQIFPLNKDKTVSRRFKKVRLQFWWEALHLMSDIPVIIGFIFILCFSWCYPWRLMGVLKVRKYYNPKFQHEHEQDCIQDYNSHERFQKLKFQIFASFILLIIDLLSTIFCLFVIFTVWRLPSFIYKLRKLRKLQRRSKPAYSPDVDSSFEVHLAILKQFILVWVDIVMLIFLIIIFCTGWRILPMIRKIRKHSKHEDPDEEENEEEDADEDPVCVQQEVFQQEGKEEKKKDEVPVGVNVGADNPAANEKSPDGKVDVVVVGDTVDGAVDEMRNDDKNTTDIETNPENEKNETLEVGFVQNGNPSFLDWFFGIRGWKIRKAICLNIFGLILDVPSFILLLINCLFIYQIPVLIQRFLESGDFYQEFFLIMLDETKNLLQDIVFFFVFLVLVVVRPFAVWRNLLEDTDHYKGRKAQQYLRTLQHISCDERSKLKKNIESVISVFVKHHQIFSFAHEPVMKRLIDEVMVYTDQLQEYRDKLLERELNDELIYIVANIHFFESKKPYLYTREYELEEMFLRKPAVAARDRNLQTFKNDMESVQDKLNDFYARLLSFEVPMPRLYSEKIGFFMRTRKQNQKVIIGTISSGNFGTVALFLLNCLFIYRAPTMIRNMCRVSYCRQRTRNAALEQTKEYFRDLIAVLKCILVVLSIYRCPALISDLTDDLFRKFSVTAARKTIDKYPVDIFEDILDLLSLFFRWDTVIFIFASILFIILIPLSVITNTVRAAGINICFVMALSIPLYIGVMSGPFIIVFKAAQEILDNPQVASEVISYTIAGYFGLIIALTFIFVIVKTRAQDTDDKDVKVIDYVRFNWFNAQVVFLEILEAVQLLALVLSVPNLAFPSAGTTYTVAKYILLDIYSFEIRFGLLAALFAIWVVTCTVPSLLEGVTKKVPKGHFSKNHFAWRSLLSFFGITLFVTIPEMAMSLLSCDYSQCSDGSCPVLSDDAGVACWSGSHLVYASLSFIFMVWYVLTSLLFCLDYTDVSNKRVDLHFSPPYSALVNLVKLLLIVGISLFSEAKIPVLGFIAGLMITLIILSLVFHKVTGMHVCNSKPLLIWRIETFILVLIVSASILVHEVFAGNGTITDDTFEGPFMILVIVAAGLILVSIFVAAILSKILAKSSDQEKARAEFKKTINSITKNKDIGDVFIPHWVNISSPFARMLRVVRVAHKNDKSFQSPDCEYIAMDGGLPPPPTYDDSLLSLPPPPSYDNVVGESPQELTNPELGTDIIQPVADLYFLPTPAMYLTPVGSYEDYDAATLLARITRSDPNPGGIFKTGWILDETIPGSQEKSLTDTHCTGIDLLLLLEEHIRYTALSYEFVSTLPVWRDDVKCSNWVGLRDAALKLRDNITFTFNKPRNIQQADESDMLEVHTDTSHLPGYVPLGDVTSLKLEIHRREVGRLMDILPEPWLSVFRRLIPAADSSDPLIFRVTVGADDEYHMRNVKIEMFKEVEILIKGIEADGFKAAIGASVVLPNPIVIDRINKTNKRIHFGAPFPYGKKGMLAHNITSCSCKQKGHEWSLVAAGKSVKLNKVLASLSQLEWTFRDK